MPEKIRVLLNFRKPDAQLVADAIGYYDGLRDNSNFQNPPIPLDEFKGKIDVFASAVAAAADGGTKSIRRPSATTCWKMVLRVAPRVIRTPITNALIHGVRHMRSPAEKLNKWQGPNPNSRILEDNNASADQSLFKRWQVLEQKFQLLGGVTSQRPPEQNQGRTILPPFRENCPEIGVRRNQHPVFCEGTIEMGSSSSCCKPISRT